MLEQFNGNVTEEGQVVDRKGHLLGTALVGAAVLLQQPDHFGATFSSRCHANNLLLFCGWNCRCHIDGDIRHFGKKLHGLRSHHLGRLLGDDQSIGIPYVL